MKKIILIGKTGQVGQALALQLPALGQLTCLGRHQLDLSQPDSIRHLLHHLQPDLIVNAAAYTAVDRAEAETPLANAINGTAPTVMAQAAEEIGARFVHISTDYVFDGQHHRPYLEAHPTAPLGAYGRSKLLGEKGICATAANAVILRTAWVYGASGHGNFVKTMLRLGRDRPELRVVADQIGTPTCSTDIARAICALSQTAPLQANATAETNGPEIYHFTNSGVASWYDFAVAIFEEARALGFPLQVQRVIPIATEDYPTPAQRPAYSVLCNRKINQRLGQPAQHWRQALRQMLAELQPMDAQQPVSQTQISVSK